jgi:signal transduction histidine kinase/CheY-like chemotaxis protein
MKKEKNSGRSVLLRKEEDERARAMYDAIPLACMFWDPDGNMVDCNQAALDLLEVPSKKDFLEHFLDYSMERQADGGLSRELVPQYLEEVCATGKKKFNWVHRTSKGEPIPVEIILVRIDWHDSYRIAAYVRDLRKIKYAEEQMREANERSGELEIQTRAAQVASAAKSRFLATVSHEIRTPMNVIIGMSDLIRTDNLDDSQKEFFTDIKKMSKALLQIINDILDISKIEAGRMELAPVHFHIAELFDNISSLSRFTAESKNLDFRSSCAADIPEVLYGDDVRIRQVITNIVNNAIKYTREGYVDFRISRLVKKKKNYLAISVQDTGIGIKKKDYPKLFGSFQQLDSGMNRGITGTGLGLAINKHLVNLMNGHISFESEYGKGSVFTVLLPLIPGDPEQVKNESSQPIVMASGKEKVLVVDDNRINLKVALSFLLTHGIHAETAESGGDAIAKIQNQRYDLIFMDHMMPEMNGVEAARRIRAWEQKRHAKKTPIIALSANSVSGARELFLAAGMNDFLSKPIDDIELNHILKKWLLTGSSAAALPDREAPAAGGGVAPVPSAAHSPIDRKSALRNIGGSEELYRQLLRSFKKDHGADYKKMDAAIKEGDLPLAHRLVHTLKSTAALVGAERIRRVCYRTETALKDRNRKAALKELPLLKHELASALTAVETELSRGL